MRLRTIWTMPAASLRERLLRTREWAAMGIAARLPLRIRYWVTILEVGAATVNSENVPSTTLNEIMQNLRQPKHVA